MSGSAAKILTILMNTELHDTFIANDIEAIVEELGPLLLANDSLDTIYVESLKQYITLFSKAVECTYISKSNAHGACSKMASLLERWGSSSTPVDSLSSVYEKMFLVHINALDAQKAYTEAKDGLEGLCHSFMQSHGSKSVISIDKNTRRDSSCFRISADNLASIVFPKFDKSCNTVSVLGISFLQLSQWVSAILQDESVTLGGSVEDTPLWFDGAVETWRGFASSADSESSGIARVVYSHTSVFELSLDTLIGKVYHDRVARNIQMPTAKVTVTNHIESAEVRQGLIPRLISLLSINGHTCTVQLMGIDRSKVGVTKVRLRFDFVILDLLGPLHNFAIRCVAAHSTPGAATPIKISDYYPQSAEDISTNPEFLPYGRKPRLTVLRHSPSALDWKFSQPDRRSHTWSDSLLHEQGELSITVEHVGEFKLNVDIDAMRLKWRIWKRARPCLHTELTVYA